MFVSGKTAEIRNFGQYKNKTMTQLINNKALQVTSIFWRDVNLQEEWTFVKKKNCQRLQHILSTGIWEYRLSFGEMFGQSKNAERVTKYICRESRTTSGII